MAKQLQLLRNGEIFGTKRLALTGLDTQLKKLSVGEPAIASYTDGEKVSILLGISYGDGTNYQIFEGAKIGADGNLEIPKEVQDAIKDAVDGIIGGASGGYDTLGEIETLIKGLQSELDATQFGAGLGTNGSYTAKGDANYISGAISLKSADEALDAALKAEETARTSADKALQTAIDTLEGTVTTNTVVAGLGIDVTVGENTTVSAKIKTGENALKVDGEGLYVDDSVLDKYVGSNAIAVSDAQDGIKTISLTIDGNDKVLTQAVSGLKTSLSLNYSSGTKTLQLLGNAIGDSNVISEIDAAAFVKDGILQNVELVELTGGTVPNPQGLANGTYLKFTFNTDAGAEKIYVNVTSLIDVYTAGNGIEVSGKVISVKRDKSSESFLTVGADGVKLSGVQTAIDQAEADAISTIKGNVETLDTLGKIEDKINTIDGYTINTKAIKDSPVLNGADIAITGYVRSEAENDDLQLKVTDTVNGAFGKLEKAILDNEEVCSAAFDAVATAVGLNRKGMTYVAPAGTYVSGASSVQDADAKLDAAIKTVSDKVTSIESDKNYVKTVIVNGVTGSTANNTATVTIDGGDITLTGYNKGSESTDITASDTINTAFGKVENKISTLDGNVLKQVVAGDGISVTAKSTNSQTISISENAVWDCGVY